MTDTEFTQQVQLLIADRERVATVVTQYLEREFLQPRTIEQELRLCMVLAGIEDIQATMKSLGADDPICYRQPFATFDAAQLGVSGEPFFCAKCGLWHRGIQ